MTWLMVEILKLIMVHAFLVMVLLGIIPRKVKGRRKKKKPLPKLFVKHPMLVLTKRRKVTTQKEVSQVLLFCSMLFIRITVVVSSESSEFFRFVIDDHKSITIVDVVLFDI